MKKTYAKGAAPSREPAAPSAHPLWARLENKGLTLRLQLRDDMVLCVSYENDLFLHRYP